MLTSFACVLWPAHHFKHGQSFSLFHVGQERKISGFGKIKMMAFFYLAET